MIGRTLAWALAGWGCTVVPLYGAAGSHSIHTVSYPYEPASWAVLGCAGIFLTLVGSARTRWRRRLVSALRGMQLLNTARLKRVLLAGIAWMTFCTGAVRGTSMVETVPFTILAPTASNQPPQSIEVLTPQFNPSLGTLESATTTISGTINTALEFFNTGAGGSYDVFVSDTLSLGGIPGLFGQELTGVVPADQPVFTAPVTFPFGPVDRGDPSELVLGSGTWSQLFSLPFPTLAVNQTPATVLVPGMSITGSSVTTYTYTPVTTPEPRLMFLPALVFAGTVRVWNRRRRGLAFLRPGRRNAS